jgi:hypothetical protein
MLLRSVSLSLVVSLGLSSQITYAGPVRLKTSQDCRWEYAVNEKKLEDIGRSRSTFISICLQTPAGVSTDVTGWKPFVFEAPPERPGVSGYKSGYQYTPAYLSSPQLSLEGH